MLLVRAALAGLLFALVASAGCDDGDPPLTPDAGASTQPAYQYDSNGDMTDDAPIP